MFGNFLGSCEDHEFLSKIVRLLLRQLLEKLGLFCVSISGHTDCKPLRSLMPPLITDIFIF